MKNLQFSVKQLRDKTTHVVVCFIDKTYKKKSVDLVPRSHNPWLSFHNSQWLCFYPHKKDYQKIGKWVRNSKEPSNKWTQYEVQIIKEAGNLFIKVIYT